MSIVAQSHLVETVRGLAERYPEKWAQALERPVLLGWFVGKAMKETGGAADTTLLFEVALSHYRAALDAKLQRVTDYCDCQLPPGRVRDFAAISITCPIHGDAA